MIIGKRRRIDETVFGIFISMLIVMMSSQLISGASITGYVDENYKGKKIILHQGKGGQLKLDDCLSSIRVPKGMYIRLYENNDKTGLARTYYRDHPTLCGLSDRVSSYEAGYFSENDFWIIFYSDPQMDWNRQNENFLRYAAFTGHLQESWETNHEVAQAIKKISDYLGHSRFGGVVINGDISNTGQQDQVRDFEDLFTMGKTYDCNTYVGLGNHDQGNNNGYDTQHTLRFIDHHMEMYADVYETNRDILAYSWDIGNIHFIQANWYPGKNSKTIDWITGDLNKTGKPAILNYHDPARERDWDYYTPQAAKNKVKAIFTGHLHEISGYYSRRSSPIFIGGSAVYGTFLLTRFKGNDLHVYRMCAWNHDDKENIDGGLHYNDAGTWKRISDVKTFFTAPPQPKDPYAVKL